MVYSKEEARIKIASLVDESIDQPVYGLYELNEDTIGIVESS